MEFSNFMTKRNIKHPRFEIPKRGLELPSLLWLSMRYLPGSWLREIEIPQCTLRSGQPSTKLGKDLWFSSQ